MWIHIYVPEYNVTFDHFIVTYFMCFFAILCHESSRCTTSLGL